METACRWSYSAKPNQYQTQANYIKINKLPLSYLIAKVLRLIINISLSGISKHVFKYYMECMAWDFNIIL